MKICLIGEFSGTPDEGMKKISRTIADRLALKHEVLELNTKDVRKVDVIRELKKFSPQVVHYLHGPTIRSLFLLKGIKALINNCKVVVSATRPYFSEYSRWAIRFLKPDLILTQSEKFESFFKTRGCAVSFLPNGVDCDQFSPVDEHEKLKIRRELDLPEDKKIVLHVGHIKRNRQLHVFQKIQEIDSVQVVIVGGTAQKTDEKIKVSMERAGVRIFHKYFKDVSIIYKSADMYIFPIQDTGNQLPDAYNQVGAIDLPLSVMEAMACNLPVITTRFGALPRLFEPGDGFFYAEDDSKIVSLVQSISDNTACNTREKVLPYGWDAIVSMIESEYQKLLE